MHCMVLFEHEQARHLRQSVLPDCQLQTKAYENGYGFAVGWECAGSNQLARSP